MVGGIHVASLLKVFRFFLMKKKMERMAEMEEKYSNEGHRPISSVLSNGEYSVRVEDHFAETFPRYRPRYE